MVSLLDYLWLRRFHREQADIARIGVVFLTDPVQLRRGLARRAGLGWVRMSVLLRRMVRWGWLEGGWQVQAGWNRPLNCYRLTDCGRRCLSWPDVQRAIVNRSGDACEPADRKGAVR